MTKNEREIKKMVESCGLQMEEMTVTGGSHIKTRIKAPDGRTHLQVFPGTSRSRRGLANAQALLKRFARGVEA